MLGRSRTNEPAAYDAMRENDQLMELSGVSAATFAAGVKKVYYTSVAIGSVT